MYMCVVTVDMRYGWRCSHSHEFDLIMVTEPVHPQTPHSIMIIGTHEYRHHLHSDNEYRHPYETNHMNIGTSIISALSTRPEQLRQSRDSHVGKLPVK